MVHLTSRPHKIPDPSPLSCQQTLSHLLHRYLTCILIRLKLTMPILISIQGLYHQCWWLSFLRHIVDYWWEIGVSIFWNFMEVFRSLIRSLRIFVLLRGFRFPSKLNIQLSVDDCMRSAFSVKSFFKTSKSSSDSILTTHQSLIFKNILFFCQKSYYIILLKYTIFL